MDLSSAIEDFHRARRRAAMQELISWLKGETADLLSYEEVRRQLKATAGAERGLHDIPLDAIVGSVGRYTDFTRSFLPKDEVNVQRWARVKVATLGMTGLPAIDVYRIGDVYFVSDGNHRVSVARELGATHIQAYVTVVRTDVPLTPDIKPDDLILKAEYADFLRWSNLKRALPDVELSLTSPGKYEDLREHISVHRYYMGLEQERPIPLSEAVAHWHEVIYGPVVETINRLGLLRDFPDRTEADLYLWVAERRAAIEKDLGWAVDPAAAAESLASEYSPQPDRVIARVSTRLANAVAPESLSPTNPAPGQWREKQLILQSEGPEHLFKNILVSLDGSETGWMALEQALVLAKLEQGRVVGLHILAAGSDGESEATLQLARDFNTRCDEAGIPGELAINTGTIAHEVTKRAKWADLLVAPLNHPPGSSPLEKLRSGFRTMIVRAPCPVLALPAPALPAKHAVLAYDGSPKAREALFVATYLASRWPGLSLMTLSVDPDLRVVMKNLEEVESYLDGYGLRTEILALELERSDVGSVIREIADTHDSDLVIMGGYGYTPILEVMLGSAVNEVLRTTCRPTLICR